MKAIAAAAAALLLAACGRDAAVTEVRTPSEDAPEAATNRVTVIITDTGFVPATIVLRAGERVRWINVTSRNHTIAELHAATPISGIIPSDAAWESPVTFDRAFKYRCTLHSGGREKGRIYVTP